MQRALIIVVFGVLFVAANVTVSAQNASQPLRPFTVADDIALASFGDPFTGAMEPITFSPNGQLVAVFAERGLLDQNRVEDELRIYDVRALQEFVNSSSAESLEPILLIRKSTHPEGLLISSIRWLQDATGLAFLLKNEAGRSQLWLADVQRHTTKALTPVGQDVTDFDIRDAGHFAYTVRSIKPLPDPFKFDGPAATVFTGRTLYETLKVLDDSAPGSAAGDRSELWAVRGGAPFRVSNSATGRPITIYSPGQKALSLAPDGNAVVTALPVVEVPKEWPDRYPPRPDEKSLRLSPGPQDISSPYYSFVLVDQYAAIDLRSGKVSILTGAPTAFAPGWGGESRIAWSDDGHSVLLPGTFLADQNGVPPCVAIAVPGTNSVECVQPLAIPRTEYVRGVRFANGRSDRVLLEYSGANGRVMRSMTKSPQGVWEQHTEAANDKSSTEISVKQGLNDPPVLVVTDSTGGTRVVWDPNPYLKQVKLPVASVYSWKDSAGKQWKGGLYKPVDYTPGQRYPLLIQTHGFAPNLFRGSGALPTAYAARALAAAGVAVLQVPDCPNTYSGTPDEAPCHLKMYEAAIEQMVAEGLVDKDRVGIMGFSRTCYYVMQALTTEGMHLRAASITDGVNIGYLQYVMSVDTVHNFPLRDMEGAIGAPPIGAGLEEWFRRSPEFNLDKVKVPLQMVARGRYGMLAMWEPYAILRVLKKPVDLIQLNSTQHVLTKPAARLASQGGTVDWFRFWLQDYDDPDPAKAEQYKRWRELRKLQDESDKKRPAETGAVKN